MTWRILYTYGIAILVISSSLFGIFLPATYAQETPNWALQAVGQDIGNLIAVSLVLFAVLGLRRYPLKGRLIRFGVLLYFIYAFLLYAFFVHFNFLFPIYVAVLGLSAFALISGVWQTDINGIPASFEGANTKLAGFTLIGIGILFGFVWLAEIVPALLSGTNTESAIMAGLWVNPVHVIDLAFVLPGMIATGILLLKKKPPGYLFAAPWLTFAVLMGASIVANMMLELGKGNMNVVPPMAMVSVVVLLSGIVLLIFLKGVGR